MSPVQGPHGDRPGLLGVGIYRGFNVVQIKVCSENIRKLDSFLLSFAQVNFKKEKLCKKNVLELLLSVILINNYYKNIKEKEMNKGDDSTVYLKAFFCFITALALVYKLSNRIKNVDPLT